MNPEIENNTFTKRIGQTTYVVRFHYCGLCMKVTLKTILPLSGQGLHPSKKIISSRKLLPLL